MNIVILTQDDPFYLPAVFKKLLAARGKDIKLIALFPPSSGKETGVKAALKYLQIYGPWVFTRQITRYLWYRIMDKIVTPKTSDTTFYSVPAVAKAFGIETVRPSSPNNKDFLQALRNQATDLLISVACPQIMRKALLELPPMGVINIHGGKLPKYRGLMPSFWVLHNEEKEAAVTVHFADEKLDNGPIIAQRTFPIEADDTQHTLITKSKALGAELLLEVIAQFENGTVTTSENDASQATYLTFPTKQDARTFRKLGRKFL